MMEQNLSPFLSRYYCFFQEKEKDKKGKSVPNFVPSTIPTKICIKFAPKNLKVGIEYVAFLGPLVLMLLTNFVPNSAFRRCSFSTIFLIMYIWCRLL